MSEQNIVDGFIDKKKAGSNFLNLVDGESVRVVMLQDIKMITKAGFGGEEKEVLRFKCSVETSEGIKSKDFDNGTQRFAQEMQEKGVAIGGAFTLTREGESTKTRYNISDVVAGGAAVAQAAPEVAQAAPAEQVAPAPTEAPAPTAAPVEASAPEAANPAEAPAPTVAP